MNMYRCFHWNAGCATPAGRGEPRPGQSAPPDGQLHAKFVKFLRQEMERAAQEYELYKREHVEINPGRPCGTRSWYLRGLRGR